MTREEFENLVRPVQEQIYASTVRGFLFLINEADPKRGCVMSWSLDFTNAEFQEAIGIMALEMYKQRQG